MDIPIIDFSSYDPHNMDANQALAAEVDAALTTYGFIAGRNVGVSQELLQQTFDYTKAFFARPMDAKRPYAYTDPKANFGYQPILSETLQPGKPADLKEAFTMRDLLGHYDDVSAWPDEQFRELARRFFEACTNASHRVLRVFALALGADPEYFVRLHSGENVTMRFLHYPAIGFDVEAAQMGAGAHTDYGAITLLFQDAIGGLQLRCGDNEWVDVPPIAQTVNINTGDLMQRWSNGRYPSTEHRVVPKIGHTDRYSIAFFTDPDDDTLVECLPSCVSAAQPAAYAPIRAGDHIQQKIDASQSPEKAHG